MHSPNNSPDTSPNHSNTTNATTTAVPQLLPNSTEDTFDQLSSLPLQQFNGTKHRSSSFGNFTSRSMRSSYSMGSLSTVRSHGMSTSRSRVSVRSGVALSPNMGESSRHESQHSSEEERCPGVFCDYNRNEEDEEDDDDAGEGQSKSHSNTKKTKKTQMWTTEKAMRKEREALQETVLSYRRTMAATSSLTKHTPGSNAYQDIEGMGSNEGGSMGIGSGDVMIRSILQLYEHNALEFMEPSLREWCQKRERMHGSVCTALQITEPTIGQELVLCEPMCIRWSNHHPSRLGEPVEYVDLHLYCGQARSTIICTRLPNQGYAEWRAPSSFLRRESDTFKELANAAVWRIKVVDCERPHVYAFSERFRLRRSNSSRNKTVVDPEHKHELQ